MKFNYLLLLTISLLLFSCPPESNSDLDCEGTIGSELLIYNYYNENSPTISSNPIEELGNIFYEDAEVNSISNAIEIVIPGVRVRTEENNFEVTMIKIDEKENGASCFVNQYEFDTGSSEFKTDIASVLVLDMSTSLLDVIDNLKTYAKEYANTVVNSSENSTVAIVFFNDRDAIESTSFFTSDNINELNQIIDNFDNFQERTALYQATQVGIDLLENFNFDGEKSIVTFTDGGDNDSNNPSEIVQNISLSEIDRFAIGLNGNDFREDNLQNIVSNKSNLVIADNVSDLQNVFRIIGRGVISVYRINYRRSDQTLSQNESIEIRVSMETEKIE